MQQRQRQLLLPSVSWECCQSCQSRQPVATNPPSMRREYWLGGVREQRAESAPRCRCHRSCLRFAPLIYEHWLQLYLSCCVCVGVCVPANAVFRPKGLAAQQQQMLLGANWWACRAGLPDKWSEIIQKEMCFAHSAIRKAKIVALVSCRLHFFKLIFMFSTFQLDAETMIITRCCSCQQSSSGVQHNKLWVNVRDPSAPLATYHLQLATCRAALARGTAEQSGDTKSFGQAAKRTSEGQLHEWNKSPDEEEDNAMYRQRRGRERKKEKGTTAE